MNYSPKWILSTIPDAVFRSEVSRRRSMMRTAPSGGRPLTCECGHCRKCYLREKQRERRIRLKG